MGSIVNSLVNTTQDIVAHPTDIGKHAADLTQSESDLWSAKNYDTNNIGGQLGFYGKKTVDPGPSGGGPGGLQLPTTADQIAQQYGNVQSGIQQQADFVNALQAQHGLTNQNAAYQMAQNQANGTGPNPAQAQLAQATSANTANQAALMAGQRGSAANPALIARQAAMQGAANQQNAAGQAATLGAQQQLAGQQQMANIAGQQVGNLGAAQGQFNQTALGAQGNVLGGIGNQNSVIGSMTNAGTAADTERYKANLGQQSDIFGGLAKNAGSLAALFADGGSVKEEPSVWENIKSAFDEPDKPKPSPTPVKFANPDQAKSMQKVFGDTTGEARGGPIKAYAPGGQVMPGQQMHGPQSSLGKHLASRLTTPQQPMPTAQPMMMAKGGKVPALVSPGEQYLPPSDVRKVVKDGANPLSLGERIPGKPRVGGNSYANDTVPKTLESGGFVIPNSIMQSKDAAKKAAAFVAAHQKSQSLKKGK